MFMMFHAPRSHRPILIAVAVMLLGIGLGAAMLA